MNHDEELASRIEKSSGLFHALLIIEEYIDTALKKGSSIQEIISVLEKTNIAKYIAKYSSCRISLLTRVIGKDPRFKHIQKNMNLILELIQRECGCQTIGEETQQVIQQVEFKTISNHEEKKILGEKYTILKLIGEGGMGLVWLGIDRATNSKVAIKEPKITGKALIDEINVRKIRIEAEILQNLNHKNVVKFMDFFIEGGKPYLVMEYVEGSHLEIIVNPQRPLDQEEALRIFTKITEAVDYIHINNVVHRDLKPKNIFVKTEEKDYVKIIDFGTAKYYHSQLETGEAIYSPGGYTAPEQLKFIYSPQSDIWSLGGILFYLLTGRHPIVVMPNYPNLNKPPEVEKLLKKDVDQRIISVIKKSLNPNPVERYLKASELLVELAGGKTITERTEKPKIIILNKEIDIETHRIIIGRYHPESMEIKSEEPIVTLREGDNLYIFVKDPKSYISRLHLEIYEKDNRWFIRDLGSLNKSAIMKGDSWEVIHVGHRIPSKPIELGNKAIISLGYDEKLGPYLVLSFINPKESN